MSESQSPSTAGLGLPEAITTCLFDLDGVITKTSVLHARAWKEMFDEFLAHRSMLDGGDTVPFDADGDYARFVDGKQRADGVRTFLASRGIHVPEGHHEDPPDRITIHGLGNRKNDLVLQLLRDTGIDTYPGTVRYLREVRRRGFRTGLVSSSANAGEVLETVHLTELFDVRVDGVVAREEGLPGKPAPDTFLYAARLLETPPGEAAVFEDAVAGVSAAAAGGFGYVVGVDRLDQADALAVAGADVVVADLVDLLGG